MYAEKKYTIVPMSRLKEIKKVIQDTRQELMRLDFEVCAIIELAEKTEGHNKGKAGRPTLDNKLVSDINRLRDAGMSYKKISHKLNISAATAHKYSEN